MTINLGRYITVVSGQNGTGKSTLLGMLGQPFGLVDKKDVFGRSMRAKFTDMFKLSPEHDAPGEHIYYVNLRDQDLYQSGPHVQVKSYKRDGYKLPIRLVTGARRGKETAISIIPSSTWACVELIRWVRYRTRPRRHRCSP